MVQYLYNHIIYDLNFLKIIYLLTITVLIYILQYVIVRISICNFNVYLDTVTYIEEFFVSLIASLWIFQMLYLHVALVLWVLFYFVYNKLNKYNRVVRLYSICEDNKHNSKIVKKIYKAQDNKSLLKRVYLAKKDLYIRTEWDFITRKQWDTTKMPLKIYAVGTVACMITNIINGNMLWKTGIFAFRLLDNFATASGLFYLLYWCCYVVILNNPTTIIYKNTKLFNGIFAVIAVLVCAFIVLISIPKV